MGSCGVSGTFGGGGDHGVVQATMFRLSGVYYTTSSRGIYGMGWLVGVLDNPIWIKTGPDKEDIIEGGEEWFGHIFGIL